MSFTAIPPGLENFINPDEDEAIEDLARRLDKISSEGIEDDEAVRMVQIAMRALGRNFIVGNKDDVPSLAGPLAEEVRQKLAEAISVREAIDSEPEQ